MWTAAYQITILVLSRVNICKEQILLDGMQRCRSLNELSIQIIG